MSISESSSAAKTSTNSPPAFTAAADRQKIEEVQDACPDMRRRRLALRNFVGVKQYSLSKLRVKSKEFRYPNSAAMVFTGTLVAINRSTAFNKRLFLAYSLTPRPV
jgi:hypothetical protein